jgi:hypothetical protein
MSASGDLALSTGASYAASAAAGSISIDSFEMIALHMGSTRYGAGGALSLRSGDGYLADCR